MRVSVDLSLFKFAFYTDAISIPLGDSNELTNL